jgi:hypothetical protein
MKLDEALSIMGPPDEVREYPDNDPGYKGKTTMYFYNPPYGSSEWIDFTIDTTKTVVAVNPY